VGNLLALRELALTIARSGFGVAATACRSARILDQTAGAIRLDGGVVLTETRKI
jgi:hypothetical protein